LKEKRMFRRIDERVLVAGQITADDLEAAKAEGITMIVNNRRTARSRGSPRATRLKPLRGRRGFSIATSPSPQAFRPVRCRRWGGPGVGGGAGARLLQIGTRSTFLWALARAQAGEDGEGLSRKAAGAGYDLTPIRGFLQR
jgi:protein tyrosine phosphatase (PTP) superfamily phosphohydrolase (DUF442 family)